MQEKIISQIITRKLNDRTQSFPEKVYSMNSGIHDVMKTPNTETLYHTSTDNPSDCKCYGLHLNEKGTAILCKSLKLQWVSDIL